jgi:hypothetical protein
MVRSSRHDWTDIRRLVRASERIAPTDIIAALPTRLGLLRQLTELEQQVIADAKSGWNEPLIAGYGTI